jgi:hypothetical protein
VTPVTTDGRTPPRPVQDEWGIFDPAQAGFAAVLRRLAAAQSAPEPGADSRPDATTTTKP